MKVNIIVGYLKVMQKTLQHYHIDLAAIGLPKGLIQNFANCLADDQAYDFDVEQYCQLLEGVQSRFTRPISLVLAEQIALQDVGLVGYLVSTSMNLNQALQLFKQYYPLLYKMNNLYPLEVEEHNEYLQLRWRGAFERWKKFSELNMALIFKYVELMVQENLISPHWITLGYAPDSALFHYERFFRCPVRLSEKYYSICISKQALDAKSSAADQQLNQVLSSQAEQSLNRNSKDINKQQFLNKMMIYISAALQQQQPLQQYVAEKLHCSERTLQRQLQYFELNFQQLVDGYRLEQSQQLLQQAKSLTEVAELLGYADQSSFGRAFKRWTGHSPKQYVKSLNTHKP